MTPPTPLYDLLPELYRRRDAERGHALLALLAVIDEQRTIVRDEIDQLYDDWFVETCQDRILPHVGAVVGWETTSAPPSRFDVAGTVSNRRRKGTLAVLEDLAADVAGWPARAVEFRTLLGVHPSVRLLGTDAADLRRRTRHGRMADLRNAGELDRVGGPFDRLAHTVDVRRPTSARTPGRHNIPSVGVFVWRLHAHSVTRAPAYGRDQDLGRFTFSILGNDTPLLTRPEHDRAPVPGDETAVPGFVGRRALADRTAAWYGPGKSLCLWTADPAEGAEPLPLDRLVVADLTGWRHRPPAGRVAVDPVLGRIAFPADESPDPGVWVTYHHGFASDVGGGEYRRAPGPPDAYRVGEGEPYATITEAIAAWREARRAGGPASGVVELVGSHAHQGPLDIRLDRGDRLTLRAAAGSRPVLRLLDWQPNRPDPLRVTGTGDGDGPAPEIGFDGLMVTGRSVRVTGDVGRVLIRDCTLVPGWSLYEDCCGGHPGEPALELFGTPDCVQIERSILGPVLVNRDPVRTEPVAVFVSDSVLDAAGRRRCRQRGPDGRPEHPRPARLRTAGCALSGLDGSPAHAVLSARRTTVFGTVTVRGVELVENSILDVLRVRRRDRGCVRFSYLAPGSATPAAFHCEPEHSGAPDRVRPVFTSRRYGNPGYTQLGGSCPDEIRRGADDASEMGIHHDLFEPQRTDDLRRRLGEFLPAGHDAGLITVT